LNSTCEVCGSDDTTTVLSLASTPLEDQFLKRPEHQILYPVELSLCKSCGNTYLPLKVSPILSYFDYLYESKVTSGLRTHYDEYAKDIYKEYSLSPSSLVVDLGSNDGSMLESFKRLGVRVLGVEPSSRLADSANQLGLPTICSFFTELVLGKITEEHGFAEIVTANYMFANVEEVVPFTKRVARLLSKNGSFIVQAGYHPIQFKKNMFDYIYHEHFSYFTVGVIDKIFDLAGLSLVDVQVTEPKGGSIRAVGMLQSSLPKVKRSVAHFIREEHRLGIRTVKYYQDFFTRLQAQKNKLANEIIRLRASGFKFAGFGASHSTTTLIYNFGLGNFLEFIVDDNPVKHHTFSPGKHIPVFEVDALVKNDVKFVVVLAWQHFETIVNRHRTLFKNKGISLLRPLPEFELVQL